MVLTVADLETNVLDFRHRAFQFDRLVDLAGGPYAVFFRTETESERRLRPKLVRLMVAVPLAWVVADEAAGSLRIARDGTVGPADDAPAIEAAAEPPEFEDSGVRWKRAPGRSGGYVYVPTEAAPVLLGPEGLRKLGLD